jgi:hypothetical protein
MSGTIHLFYCHEPKINGYQRRCFRKKASMSMAKQKAPNARRAIVEQWGVLTYVEAARAIAATQQLVSFCDAIKGGKMPHHPFQISCQKCFYANRIDVAEVNCREIFVCQQCGEQLRTSEVLKKAVETLDRSLDFRTSSTRPSGRNT